MNTDRTTARYVRALILAMIVVSTIATAGPARADTPGECPDEQRSARGYCPDDLDGTDGPPEGSIPDETPIPDYEVDPAAGPDPDTDEARDAADRITEPVEETHADPIPDPEPLPEPIEEPDPMHDETTPAPAPIHEEPASAPHLTAVPDATPEPATPASAPVASPTLPETGLASPLLALIGGAMLAAGALIVRATGAGEVGA